MDGWSQLSTQKNLQFQLCFPDKVIVCSGKQAVQPWLKVAALGLRKGVDGEALLSGLGSEPLAALPSQASLAATLLSLLQ